MSAAFGKCFDPSGARYGIPTYPWKFAPDDDQLATRRQLRARGLRPGGQPIAAQIMRINRRAGTSGSPTSTASTSPSPYAR